MKFMIALTAGILLLALPAFSILKKKRNMREATLLNDAALPGMTGPMVADTLDQLGYFKYAGTDKRDSLKKEIADTYDRAKVLATLYGNTRPYQPFCYRLYSCDGETLFEYGGIVEYLQDIKPTFDKMHIPLTWENERFSENGREHSIFINGKKYFAYEGDPGSLKAWGIATKNFVEMINDQLSIHQSDERLYPILFNNDGQIVFLTRPQYDFISKHFDPTERPMAPGLWWKTFGR